MKYKVKRFIRNIKDIPYRFIIYPFQKARHGFSDQDAFNGDSYLAGQIAGILEWMVKNGHGVSMAYHEGEDPFNLDVETMVIKRDADYLTQAANFREYQKHGTAFDQEWKDGLGGLLDNEVEDLLQWLKDHFQELWD